MFNLIKLRAALSALMLLFVSHALAEGYSERGILDRFMAESPRTRGLRAQVEISRAEMRGRGVTPLAFATAWRRSGVMSRAAC